MNLIVFLFSMVSGRQAESSEAETHLVDVAPVDITPDYPIHLNDFVGVGPNQRV